MEVVYFGSDPRKTHLGSGKVIYRRKEVNKECVNKQVTAWATRFLLAGSLWERELLQPMGNALGHLSTNSPLISGLRVESRGFGLSYMWPQCALQA